MRIYKEIFVWKRVEDHAIRYFCLQDLETGRFCVQNADFFYSSLNAEYIAQLDKQIIELFLEEDPYNRCDWFDSLTEAIKGHDDDFID